MREIIIEKNDANQRLDRFMIKYLSKAPKSLINKYIRLKKVKVNKKKALPSDILLEGDILQLYIYEEELEKFEDRKVYSSLDYNLNIIYEDENIALINKPVGVLSHAASSEDYGKNIVDNFMQYLIKTKQYLPRQEKSFVPAISNRLDRNTSGILIGCKNRNSLLEINKAIKEQKVNRYYLTICKGDVKDSIIDFNLTKNENNKVEIDQYKGKKSITIIRNLIFKEGYSLLEINLITGRTHQIRVHLKGINHPVIGDRKYGISSTNEYFKEKYGLNNQLLHAYKIGFSGIESNMNYLNNKEFIAPIPNKFKEIMKDIFGGESENIFR